MGPFSLKYSKRTYQDLILMSIFPSLVFHFIGILSISLTNIYYPDLKILINIFVKNDIANTVNQIDEVWMGIIIYGFFINLISGLLGILVRLIVYYLYLDLRWEFLSYSNTWYYYLSGDFLFLDYFQKLRKMTKKDNKELKLQRWRATKIGMKKDIERYNSIIVVIIYAPIFILRYIKTWVSQVEKDKPDMVIASVLTVVGSQEILYQGIVYKFQLSANGGLEYVILEQCSRKTFSWGNWRYVEGNRLLIDYSTIKNINISYFEAKPVKHQPSSS